jgi:type IV fimbrial biogenesis protein FimT
MTMTRLRRKTGFTLIEMVITAVVAGLIAALAVPSFYRSMQKLKLNAATREIVSDLRWARSKAISTRKQVGINLDFANKRYSVFFDINNPGAFQFSSSQDSVVKTGDLTGLGTGNTTLTDSTVIFMPSGSSNRSGQITCNSRTGSFSRTVDILASTGRVKITS